MKKIIFIFLIFNSCQSQKISSISSDRKTESVDNSREKFKVTGMATHSQSYCGGARPSDEMLLEITSPKPLASTEFYVREGNVNDLTKKVLMTFNTDENGNFNIQLPAGDYVIIEKNRVDSSYYNSVLNTYSKATNSYSSADKTCLQNWLNGSLIQFTVVDADVNSINWNIHSACFVSAPCVEYLGPYPP